MNHGVVAAALVPHPPIVIPAVGGAETERVSETRRAMHDLASELGSVNPDCVVLIDPHGPVGYDEVPLVRGRSARGDLGQFRAPSAAVDWAMDVQMTEKLADMAAETDQAVRVHDPGEEHFLSHGAVVPLYLLQEAGFTSSLVYAGNPLMQRDNLWSFGRLVARAAEEADKKVVVIASGDLSHRLFRGAPSGYHPDGEKFDRVIVESLSSGDAGAVRNLPETLVENAGQCGYNPLLIALAALGDDVLSGSVLSYEGPFGVGYAVAHLQPEVQGEHKNGQVDPVQLARRSVEHYLSHGRIMTTPTDLSPDLKREAGAFVTIKEDDQLRGCIGTVLPTRSSLAEEIIHNAVKAATRDPRFLPVSCGELFELRFSVDVLGAPEEVTSLEDLDPAQYGVIVSRGTRRGLLLPNLEGIHTVRRQLETACHKANLSPDDPGLVIERFKVTRYTES